ncbi:Fe(3+) ABC transporter substrate-binding protein [Wolbachia pipientis]|uniref:Fe(3+) ABC transporter substrate-binding protein n=1 Tax=Wolbachia pipientis TaxID=955 RepID=A0A1E7QL13_WOLPI|nr:extracellular solute-binding protein [Wolbachia pipientis]OEY87133.1 Fe(3+) ABC transporter substrate-binding protein [Wolbachia pipientis]
MKKSFILTALVIVIAIIVAYLYQHNKADNQKVVNVYSARKEELVRALFADFTNKTDIKVRYITGDDSQLLSRIENGGDADLFLTADAVNLILAESRGLLSKVDSKILKDSIPEQFRDNEDYWFGLTKRTRILVYNKDLINPNHLTTYEDLANPKWKGKILVSSSISPYNRSLIAFMIANHGFEKTKKWVTGIVNNMARKPSSGDTDQIDAAAAGEGGIAIVNSYYFARMLAKNKKSMEKLGIFFPNQKDKGAMVNISGAAVVKNAKNRENAILLLEFLVSKEAQELYAKENHEYPIVKDVEVSDILKSWGNYVQSDLPLKELEKHLLKAVMIADECKWR